MCVNYVGIGRNIRQCRKQRGLRQAQLAKMVGVSEQHISHVECGSAKLSLPLLCKLADLFQVDVRLLLAEETAVKEDDTELMELLQMATAEQRKLCTALCRTVILFRFASGDA